MPRLSRAETAESKEERKKKRIERLDSVVSPQNFCDWRIKEIAEHPETVISAEPLW